MSTWSRWSTAGPLAAFTVLLTAGAAAAQTTDAGQSYEALGTRAAGMGGAFVGVADDATAVYWNPAGLAAGAFLSLVIDNGSGESKADDSLTGGSRLGSTIALAMPALGLSYYRIRATTVRPTQGTLDVAPAARLQTLVTQHLGVTLVQSVTERIAVGATIKTVRGSAAAGVTSGSEPRELDDLLDSAENLRGSSSNAVDADLGVMAAFGPVKAGLAVRNVRQPEFELGPDRAIRLQRQTRAGASYIGVPGIIVAADLDLERVEGPLGEVRNFATGVELQVVRRGFVRTGFRVNTIGDEPGGRAPVYTLGGSYAAFSSMLVDAQITTGASSGDLGWGVAARVVF